MRHIEVFVWCAFEAVECQISFYKANVECNYGIFHLQTFMNIILFMCKGTSIFAKMVSV